MPIDTQHPQYALALNDWRKIEDITRQKNLHNYLLILNETDLSDDNKIRNRKYRERALFYALTTQTAAGMLGTIFKKWPTMSNPTALDYLKENADGAGISIYQQAQGVCDDVIRKSRGGLVVSYPKTQGQVSRADIQSGRTVATIHRLEPEAIINWRTTTIGSVTKLSLVVIKEVKEEVGEDGYSVKDVEMIRELYLEEGVYRERHWFKGTNTWQIIDEFTPTDASGQPWDEIPFIFVGSENNDPNIDHPHLLGMVDVNIAHYRNSADYEDSIWYAGQAQPWMSNVDQGHIDLMQKNNMYVGSRTLLAVPEGGQFGFACAEPNLAVREAMRDKVDLMVGLGARMIQVGSAAKTATEAAGEMEVQHSTLSLIASNVSEAYTQALQWVAKYMGVEDPEMAFTLSQDYVDPEATPQELQAVMAGFLQGSMPMSDYVDWMKKRGYFDDEKPLEEYAEELDRPPMREDGLDAPATD